MVALAFVAAAIVLTFYVVISHDMPKHVFWSSDEGGRFIELRSVQWDGGIAYTMPYRGRHLDPDYRFFPDAWVYPGRNADATLRMPWPIWFPLLSSVPFALFGFAGLYIVPLLSGLLIAIISGVLSRRLGSGLAPLTILLVGLASPVFFYSLTFWEHTLATLIALLAVVPVMAGGGRPRALFGAMSLVFMACLLRLEMLAFLAALPIAAWICSVRAPLTVTADDAGASWLPASPVWRRWLPLAVAAVIGFVVIVALSLPSHRIGFLSEPFVRANKIAHLLRMPNGLVELVINNSESEGPQVHRVFARLTFAAACLVVVAAFERRARIEAVLVFPALAVVLAFSTWLVLLSQPYRAMHSIVPVAPYVVVAPYAVAQAWRERRRPQLMLSLLATVYLVLGIAAVLIFYLRGGGLATTLEWGQRYVLTLYPLLAILALYAVGLYWRSSRSLAQRLLFVVLVGAMIGVGIRQEFRGLKMLHENRTILAAWDSALRARGPVVTDVWWLPAAVADLFTTRDMFVIEDRAALGDWIDVARRGRVRRFTFASLGKPFEVASWPEGIQRYQIIEVQGLHLARIALSADAPTRLP